MFTLSRHISRHPLSLILLFLGLFAASSLLPINYAFLAWLVLLVAGVGVITNLTGVKSTRLAEN